MTDEERRQELTDQAMARYLRDIGEERRPSPWFWVVAIVVVVALTILFGALSVH